MLTSAVSVAELPAPSVAVPVTFWPAPSVLTVASPVQLATTRAALVGAARR